MVLGSFFGAVEAVPVVGFVVSIFFFLGTRGFFALAPVDGFAVAEEEDGGFGCCFC